MTQIISDSHSFRDYFNIKHPKSATRGGPFWALGSCWFYPVVSVMDGKFGSPQNAYVEALLF